MLRYRKGTAPANLTALQATPNADYGALGAADKAPLREALVRDQGALCAYCQRRIRAALDPSTGLAAMKIEHWAPQSKRDPNSLRWRNLLGVCHGGAPGAAGPADDVRDQHCDVTRADHALFLHPVEGEGPDPRQHLRYTAEGEVHSDDSRATNDVRLLNLNADKLTRARAAIYSELMRDLKRRGFTAGEVKRLHIRHQVSPGVDAPVHLEFVRYHLERKLRRFGVG